MAKLNNTPVVLKSVCLTVFFLMVYSIILSQTVLFKGNINDDRTLKSIPDVNIRLYGTTKGTSTDKTGSFTLKLNKVPAKLIITCIGYETAYFEITTIPAKPVEFLLSQKAYPLQEVDIASKKYTYLFKDKDYSVFDYELMGDNVLLLVFRYQIKRSELVLLNRSGDALAISKLPEVPPASLFKDFLSNVHYFSRSGNAYQCFFNESSKNIDFLFKTTVDSLQVLVKPFIFKISDRLYFQEDIANGFGTAFGFYEKQAGKIYIRQYFNEKRSSDYYSDQKFYATWNDFVGKSNITPFENFNRGQYFDEYEARASQIEFYNMVYPVIRTGENTFAFFNFGDNAIVLMNQDGKTYDSVPITFHKETKSKSDSNKAINLPGRGWRWANRILSDEYNHDAYTLFLRNGMVSVRKIDLETGKLHEGTVLPFPFPEKIEIYKGEACFLIKIDGSNDKWKLVKCRL